MNPITQLEGQNIEGKVVLVRVDYNVPVQDGIIQDGFRIEASFKTIEYLRNKGAKVILISHIEGKTNSSLEPVSKYPFPFPISFEKDIPTSDDNSMPKDQLKNQLADFASTRLANAPAGSVFLFENLRNNPGEKNNDPEFSSALASVADIFVGDAFSVSHRKHASIIGIPTLLPHYAGFHIMDEVSHLEKGLNPNHPFIFILGGAKFDTKLPLIQKFMHKADKILICGALLNDIMKARGLSVGKSLVSDAVLPDEIINDPSHKMINARDVVVKNMTTGEIVTKKVDIENALRDLAISPEQNPIWPDEMILDTGPSIIDEVKKVLDDARDAGQKPFILWNGPLGNYEDGFKDQTIALAKLIMDSGVDALIGGGDTTAALASLSISGADGQTQNNIYISTGGGAMIDYLIDETLPGIEALK